MKVAFVVHDYRRMEGHSRYVVELASRMASEHEVHVFANQIEIDENVGIHFHHVRALRSNALVSVLTFAVGATLGVRGDFDIIHNQGLCGWRGNVFTIHICNRAWHCALRQTVGRLTFREWVSGNTLGLLEHLFYRYARNCHAIAVSRRVATDVRQLYRSNVSMSVIYHGVDLNTFTPASRNPARGAVRAACGLDGQEMAFLFVGDLRKGARQCIQALSRMKTGKLLLISRTRDAAYRVLVSQLGLDERVHFLGSTKEVAKYYAAADALLLPTHYDSFAMVLTEAMASALPVVVSREAGASELIQNGVNGFVLEDFTDIVELAGKMSLLDGDRELGRSMGDAARRTVEDYSWDAIADRTMQIYQEVYQADPKPRKSVLRWLERIFHI